MAGCGIQACIRLLQVRIHMAIFLFLLCSDRTEHVLSQRAYKDNILVSVQGLLMVVAAAGIAYTMLLSNLTETNTLFVCACRALDGIHIRYMASAASSMAL